MTKTLFKKNIQELEANAIYWWPDFLSQLEGNASIIPLLIKTQDKFLSLLDLSDKNPYKIFDLIKSSDFPANLFLKHLVVLTDFGGEQIQRLNKQLSSVFEKKNRNGSVKVAGSKKNIPFDIVVKKGNKAVGVEVTFQVTTNSTIERKSGQAKSRRDLMHKTGNFVAYIIDGAGNFQRRSAISTICNYSDCTVAYAQKEFDTLVKFIKDKL